MLIRPPKKKKTVQDLFELKMAELEPKPDGILLTQIEQKLTHDDRLTDTKMNDPFVWSI